MNATSSSYRSLLIASGLMLPAFMLLIAILWVCNGQLMYTLDDPYIHLELARHLHHLHYGINDADYAAPSSSILWPFLLTPFAGWSYFVKLPLIINLACLFATLVLLVRLMHDLSVFQATLMATVTALSLNLYGVVFTGMEHSLQVLLAVASGVLINAHSRDRLAQGGTLLLYVCLLLLPFVRYEGLAISVPMLAYLACHGQTRRAALTLAGLVIGLAGFSLFLHQLGLGYLPSSILAKNPPGAWTIYNNIKTNLEHYGWLIAFLLPFLGLSVYRDDRPLALAIGAAVLLQGVFGQVGWLGRYEIYLLTFLAPFLIDRVIRTRPQLIYVCVLAPLAFFSLLWVTLFTPLAASNIYNQQARLATIAAELQAPVAVNDLGLISFRTDTYVLDLWGLGSLTALRERQTEQADADWMDRLMRRHGVEYAFIYPGWFSRLPDNFIKIADLKLNELRVSAAGSQVSIFARDEMHADILRRHLKAYLARHRSPDYAITFVEAPQTNVAGAAP